MWSNPYLGKFHQLVIKVKLQHRVEYPSIHEMGPRCPSEEESKQQLKALDLDALRAHTVNIVKLNVLIQSSHHLRIGLPNKNQ
jgi:hypothetical protein